MRIVTTEEHFTIRALSRRVSPDVVKARGYFSPDKPYGPADPGAKLDDIGEGRVAAMDAAGITVQVLSYEGPGADLMPPGDSLEAAREANDVLARAVAERPGRLVGLAHLPWTAPDACADELERAVTVLGFRGALVNGSTAGRYLDDPAYAPLLARAESLEVPIYMHPGIPPEPVRDAYYGGLPPEFSYLLGIAGWGWHVDTAVHILRLVLSGALDRHPGLRLITGHMGEGLPAMLARFDQMFESVRAKHLQRPVSQTIRDQLYVTTSGFITEPPFRLLMDTFGVDRIILSADYPFLPMEPTTKFLAGMPVSNEDRAKIAHGNADRLLKLQHRE